MNIRTFLLLSLIVPFASFAQVPYPGNDSDHGVTAGGFPNPYTGNVSFSTKDIVVAGAVGQYGLTWQRHATSRTSQTEDFFGLGHNWTHNWQWEMVAEGKDSQGRSVISVREPYGTVHRFVETSPGQWWSTPDVTDRIISSGDAFTLQHRGGSEARFVRQNDTFTLQELADNQGNVWKLTYASGRLVQVTEPAGRWLKISYKSLSQPTAAPGTPSFVVIASVMASDGQSVTYSYQFPKGADYPVLAKAIYPDDNDATYTYAEPRAGARQLLTQADDPRGRNNLRGRTFIYRSESDAAVGQLLEVRGTDGGAVMQALAADSKDLRAYALTQTNGATIYQTFNPGGNVAETVDALGFSHKYEYGSDGRGSLVASTDPLGKVTRYEFDAAGDMVKTIYPDKSSRSWDRDSQGRTVSQTDELGNVTRFSLDARGRVTQTRYPNASTEKTTYNEFGQVLTSTDRGGAITTMIYDARGLRTKVVNALGGVTRYDYGSRDNLAAVTDARGNTTSFERDLAGRITKTIYADDANTSVSYDEYGSLIQSTDAAGAVTRSIYDGLGRLTLTIYPSGHEARTEYAPIGTAAPITRPVKIISASDQATAMGYDAAGRLVSRTTAADTKEAETIRTAYDAVGRKSSITYPLGRSVQFFYDERGRRTKMTTRLNYVITTTYNAAGHRLSETDAKGNTTRWTYDSMGRELTENDPKGQITSREYDAAGRLIRLTDAKSNVYRFEYGPLGKQTALVYPDGSRESTVYDASGLKVRHSNRSGVLQTFIYDNRNREISSEWGDGSQRIVKVYDAAGRVTLQDNGVSKLTFAYDEAGRLASETQDLSSLVTKGTSDPEARTVRYTYTPDGKRQTLRYPDGSFVKLTYNSQRRLAEILGEGVPPPIASYEYDIAGNATLMPRVNDTETAQQFDGENKAIAITERIRGQSNPLSELNYLYDEVGNRISSTESIDINGGGNKQRTLDAYYYDETYQVTGADSEITTQDGQKNSAVRFNYDAVGNRLAVDENGTVTRYTVNNLNQYTQVGEFSPTYDSNGNLSGMGKWLYRYDAMNRLISASNGQTTARFFYDAKNRCVARAYQESDPAFLSPSSRLTLNYYDGWNLIEERDRLGAQQARYVHGRRTDEIIVIVNKYGVLYPHYDALGNVTMLTGQDGRVVERYTYGVTGQVTISNGASEVLTTSAVGNRWMFTGREWLQEVKLYDYRNRIYSAELGRFIQTDPIRFRASDINIYRYVRNSYPSYTDPSGLDWLRQDTEEYVAGRQGTIVEPGGFVSVVIEDWIPAGHTFAVNHDAFVGWAVNDMGIPDLFANVPSMTSAYLYSFAEEVINSVGNTFNWLFGFGGGE